LAAAVFAALANPAARVALLDGARSPGAKILVSGGGRCNVTHRVVTAGDFNGSPNIVRNVLASFDHRAAVRWFASMKVELKEEETGKLFPVTDSARTVLNALLRRVAELDVRLLADHRVESVDRGREGFRLTHSHGPLAARRVILCTGGRSLPRTGSDGHGYAIATSLGHTVTPTRPALVPLVLDDSFFHATLSGLSHEATLTTLADGKPVDRRTGSLLWTHFGISGPLTMDASRHYLIARERSDTVRLRLSLLPQYSFETLEPLFRAAVAKNPRQSLVTSLSTLIPQRLAEALLGHVKLDPAAPLSQLSKDHRRRLVHALTGLDLPVLKDRGWNYAEVTAGGVPLAEVDYRTMASRRCPGLLLAGEILDCDGRIGGFNFQWAWATGHLAGRAAARP
jgi:predicted Rossmann fold flavoprotein